MLLGIVACPFDVTRTVVAAMPGNGHGITRAFRTTISMGNTLSLRGGGVSHDPTVHHVDLPVRDLRHLGLVRHDHERLALLLAEVPEEAEHLHSGGGVEVPCGLVGKEE